MGETIAHGGRPAGIGLIRRSYRVDAAAAAREAFAGLMLTTAFAISAPGVVAGARLAIVSALADMSGGL